MFGSKGVTDVIDFYKYGFDRGMTKKFKFLGKPVGELQKIRVWYWNNKY
jgi:hypothetical protein